MKVTLNWLKDYVQFDWSADELAERLTRLGLEVEGIRKTADPFAGVVVAQVLTVDKHPNADKLTRCRVNDGRGERQIVCGAHNFRAGDKVPLVLPGATLPAYPNETIKAGKIRGVESQGMMCSGFELGLSQDHEGLLLLRPEAGVGQPFGEYLGRGPADVVYDLEITPNRPDLTSVLGIAREIAAVTGNPLRVPPVELPEPGPDTPEAAALVSVRLEDVERCPRYLARVIRGVKIGPSPDWIRRRLEQVGLRGINNVVDATNYVLLETGQPLHAFDYRLLGHNAPMPEAPPAIVVRRARAGEGFTTLDGQDRALTADMLLIADELRGIALAGVMGGLNTEIRDDTVDILLESAFFLPANIRRTSKALGLRTDASYRFERGADIGMTDWASRRCAQLILQTAGGALAKGAVDAYPNPLPTREITLRPSRVNEILGLTLRAEEMHYYLGQLGLRVVRPAPSPVEVAPAVAGASVTFRVPSFRVDLKREIDLIEEVARLHGVERIPSTPPRGAFGSNAFDAVHDQLTAVGRLLTGLGLHEAQGQTLIAETAARRVTAQPVLLQNPLSADMSALRPSLLPGLLDAMRHNLAHQNLDVALFEIGRTFQAGKTHPVETWRAAIALTGSRDSVFWGGADRTARFDIYDLKGMLEELLEQLGLRGVTYQRAGEADSLFVEAATVHLGKYLLGRFGQVQPALARAHDLRDAAFLAELDLDRVLALRQAGRSFKALAVYPSIRRDVALVLPDSTSHDQILSAIKQARPQHLERLELFDVFRGGNVPAGSRSLAYAFTYRSPERTLTDAEVAAEHERLVDHLRKTLSATVRQ